jgi:lipoyl(octanoyl) transferase
MIRIRRLGTTSYLDALALMRDHVARRAGNRDEAVDELWLTEHPPVYTLGFASRQEHLRDTGDIPVIATERGGQVTYHGPGQVVAYLLLDLRRRKLGLRNLVCRLEDGIIQCLAGYRLTGRRKAGAPGIYVAAKSGGPGAAAGPALAKIASIGLKVSRGLTWHGVALNGCMDLEPFSRIDPCGFPDLEMTDISTAAGAHFKMDSADLAERLAAALVKAIEG